MIKIAEGTHSEVFMTPNRHVIKKYKTANAATREINIMKKCKNTNYLLQPIDIQENQIVLPLMSPLNLLKFTTLQSKDRIHIVQSMIGGLDELHKLNIIHHDLKLENILYDPRNLSIKISDFSSSFTLSEYNALDTHNKSLINNSTSPLHAFHRKIVSKKDLFDSDRWSLAISILQLYQVNLKHIKLAVNKLKSQFPEDCVIFSMILKLVSDIKFE